MPTCRVGGILLRRQTTPDTVGQAEPDEPSPTSSLPQPSQAAPGEPEIPTVAKATTKTKRQTSSRSTKKSAARVVAEAGPDAVTIDRRRKGRRGESESPAPKLERREKVSRRRQIDPTTCERDYSDQEVEFMNALDDYKRKSGRMFPTCSEVLEVIQSLGYVKLPAGSNVPTNAANSGVSATPIAPVMPAIGELPNWIGQETTL